MGVRGMSTFIKERQEKFLARHKLHKEVVVIDGDNLIHHLNNKSNGLNHAFGGDYQKYAGKAEVFLKDLLRCGITPIILLDGGSDPSNRKLKTAFSRLTDKLDKTRKLEPATQYRQTCLPLLTKCTFVEVLCQLQLPHAVCPFEADEPLAALARQLDCAVISDDTDFFAFGVRCVPLRSLADEPELGADGQLYIDCMVFKHHRFMQEYGLRPQLMPLLACLLGNDYISPSSLKAFFRHVPRPYGERRGRPAALRIRGLLAWLRRHTNPEEALEEVLSQLRREERQAVGRMVRRSMDNYNHRWSADLLGWLRLPEQLLSLAQRSEDEVLPSIGQTGNQPVSPRDDANCCPATPSTNGDGDEPLMGAHDDADAASDAGLDDGSDGGFDDGSGGGSDDGADDAATADDGSSLTAPPTLTDGRLLLDGDAPPDWLADGLRRGLFTGDVINLISGQPLLQEPQVEDFRQPPACACVEPLLRWLASCLHGCPDRVVTLYRRADSGRSVVRRQLAPPAAGAPQPPTLCHIPAMTTAERRQAVLAALRWSELVPRSLWEPMLAQVTKPMPELEPKPQPMLQTVQQTAQEPMPQPMLKPTQGTMLDMLPERHHLLAAALGFWCRQTTAPVTAAHIGALLLPERRSEQGVSRLAGPDPTLLSGEVTFDRRLAHQLAQLQCVLAQAGNVNALMGAPLEPLSPGRVLAGPLVYNAVTQLRKFGLERAVEWMAGPSLEGWRREMEMLCQAVGVDPSLQPARPVPVRTPVGAAARSPTAGTTEREPKGGGHGKDGGRSKATRKARPQPQLTGNKFAALLPDSDSDDAMSDDS